jgi:hypothetical protein
MTLSYRSPASRQFIFEDSSGARWRITIGVDGSGLAYPADGDGPKTAETPVAITVDAGSVSAFTGYHESRLAYAAIFNTGQTLNAVLTA